MNTLIKYISVVACLLVISSVTAQQLPVMSHYIYNPYLYNPARTGQNDFGTVYANFKKQWIAMPQSPLTAILSIEGPIPGGKFNNMGIGGMIYTDQMHIISKVGGLGTYAYHIPFEKNDKYKHGLSVGISLGVINQRFNYAAATVINNNDAQLLANAANGTSFDFSGGLDYQYKNLHVGGAMLQGLNNGIKFLSPNDTTQISFVNTRHWILTASHRFNIGAEAQKHRFYIEPVFLGRIIQGLPFQAEGTVLFGMKNIGWVGAGYRSSNTETATSAISITAGVELNSRLLAAYTLDLGVEKGLNTSMGTQHEFMLAYRLGKQGNKNIEAELEKLRQKDKALEEALRRQADSLGAALAAQEENAQKERAIIQGDVDDVEKDADDLRGKVLKNEEEIERLKKLLEDRKITHKHIGEVFFAQNSDVLSDEIKSHLNTMKTMLDSYPKNITVYLYGNASIEGNSKANMELAVRRGSAVRLYLLQHGINAEKVYVIPMGEYNPLAADPNKQEYKDRRVDIMVSQED